MIPLIACRGLSLQGSLTAAAIVAASFLIGWGVARASANGWRYASVFVGLFVPCGVIFGIWPFDPEWRYDCGATPDPNLLPISAGLLFPLTQGVAFLVSRWCWRDRG
ncbi:MAG: hypothetical protein V4472_06680 [Pseudomonadota bacterium]